MIHNIDPGYYCGPSALQAITGADMLSVIVPCLNRKMGAPWQQEEVIEVRGHFLLMALWELGFRTLRYKRDSKLGTVGSWGDRYPENTMMIFTRDHVLIVHNGLAFDNHTPMGTIALNHPFAEHKVTDAYLVRPK